MPTENDIKNMARAQTRIVLGQSPLFLGMSDHEQRALYRDVYAANFNRLVRQNGLIARQTGDRPNEPGKL